MRPVSIIIVNYNGERHLRDCLDSLKSLDYPARLLDVVVFDNGSSDGSIQVIRKTLPSARIIEHPGNLGFAAPHRIAAEACRGEILAFMNNDMKAGRSWVKEGLKQLDPANGIVCSASKILSWDGRAVDFSGGSMQYLGYADQPKGETPGRGEDILFPCGGAMFIEKEGFVNSGCFDDDYFAIFEDVDLGWRLWVTGYRVVMAPDSVTYHKGHGTLDSKKEEKKRFLMHRNALMTIIKNYDDENLRKILPLAFILAVKRALLFMGVDKRAFHFWDEKELAGFRPDNYAEAFVHLAALDDVFDRFGKIMEKRSSVQKARRRPDGDIFRLFRDPFRNIMGYKEYLWAESALFGDLNLDAVFDCREAYRQRLDEGIYHARQTLKGLLDRIDEAARLSSVPVPPPGPTDGLAAKFVRNLREHGIGPTVRKSGNYLLRKLR